MRVAIELIGGLGLFLFGMNFMGTALQKVAGSKMRGILAALTNNRIIGVLVGCVVTIVVQSSSATTVMTVGFVNAGLMNLSQAIGVIMGANIGTTITAQLVAFNLTDGAPLIVGLKVAFYYGSKKKRVKEIAEIFIGFGILFLGMAYAVFEKEKAINNMEKKFRKNHMDRLNDGLCTTSTGIVFLDTLSNLERIGDHATNMAESIVEVINKGKVMTEVQGDH